MLVKHKKITKGNGVTLPKDLRANFGILAGQGIDLVETPEGILLKKHTASCFCCGSVEDVKVFKDFEICKECRKELVDIG